jgi:uncharacterized protein (DUF1697 family)
MATSIVLLRGINVGGRARVPMDELRSLCRDIGWNDVRSYIQSGNLVVASESRPAALEDRLEPAIRAHFGFEVTVIARDINGWIRTLRENPFPDASSREPGRVMLALARHEIADGAAERITASAASGERVVSTSGALWLHFPDGAGRSRLTSAVLDRAAGSPVTMRNWRTVVSLAGLAGRPLP